MNDRQKTFIQLRANGLSFDKIALELKVNKQTLIQWSKLFTSEINDLKFQSLADLKEQYKHTQRSKYETLLKHLQKVDLAIEDHDLANASIKDLVLVRNDLAMQLERIENRQTINTGLKTQNIMGEVEDLKISLKEID